MTVTGADKFALHCAAAAAGIALANRKSVSQASLAVKESTLRAASKATGGDLVISGLSRGVSNKKIKGKLGVGYRLAQTKDGASSLVSARGPWQFVEHDMPKHDIKPGQSMKSRRRNGGAHALSIAIYGAGSGKSGVYASAKDTGGSKGKHPFANGVTAAEPVAAAIFRRNQRDNLRGAFG